MNSEQPTARSYAAISLALAIARGTLYAVADGDFTLEEIRTVLRTTSLANIAAALKLGEGDIALEWDHLLTHEEITGLKFGCATELDERPDV